ncbi:MAG: phosphate ABC transporter substrate-binding protein, PhoT family [Bacteroidales bacterium]|nr:phosphate ABC transporter substrate-binding protein, PhoT family [Bacteroidales bacterium]
MNKKVSTYTFNGIWITLLILSLLFISCLSGSKKAIDETPTRGSIKIFVDESYQPIIDSEIYTFTSLYTYANITPIFKPEVDVINDFMNDSVKVIVTNKKLTDAQIKYLRDTLIIARTFAFAYDALALIVNNSNRDSLLSYNTIKNIFLGNIKTWKDINDKSNLSNISIVFDNTKSGNIRYFKEKFEITNKLPNNFYAVNSNEEVINFIKKNPNALGIISVNWISDKDDPRSQKFINEVKVIGVSSEFDPSSYYLPEQGSIYNKSYPFTREVYLISRETFSGLGSGFISWVTHDQGQRIVLKSGLVPSVAPIRLIQVKH